MSGPAADAVAHFPPQDSSAGAARRFVAATLGAWDLEPLEDVACLLVSELVSNVVLHAQTDLDVHLVRTDGRVRVEVHDGSSTLPERKFYSPTAATGRGLVFISELARSWGADPTADGKVVWFELDEAVAPGPPQQAAGEAFRLDDWEEWGELGTDPVEGHGSGESTGARNRAHDRLAGRRSR